MCIIDPPNICQFDNHFLFNRRQFPKEDIKTRKPSIASCYLFINSKEKTQQKLITIIHVLENDST